MHKAFRSLQEHQDSPQQERKDPSSLSPPCRHGPKPSDLALGPEAGYPACPDAPALGGGTDCKQASGSPFCSQSLLKHPPHRTSPGPTSLPGLDISKAASRALHISTWAMQEESSLPGTHCHSDRPYCKPNQSKANLKSDTFIQPSSSARSDQPAKASKTPANEGAGLLRTTTSSLCFFLLTASTVGFGDPQRRTRRAQGDTGMQSCRTPSHAARQAQTSPFL